MELVLFENLSELEPHRYKTRFKGSLIFSKIFGLLGEINFNGPLLSPLKRTLLDEFCENYIVSDFFSRNGFWFDLNILEKTVQSLFLVLNQGSLYQSDLLFLFKRQFFHQIISNSHLHIRNLFKRTIRNSGCRVAVD
jgi:hypothetical protein